MPKKSQGVNAQIAHTEKILPAAGVDKISFPYQILIAQGSSPLTTQTSVGGRPPRALPGQGK